MTNMKMEIAPLEDWFSSTKKPLVISGPCSAESREQVINTAKMLAATGKVQMLRAGIWKPRTRPNSFEGKGTEALSWLKEAGEITGLPISCEVANAQHVEESLKAGIDVLWIGARTTVSPFSVQEIADVLSGTNIPVMVKNPVNPDLHLWMGALERLNRAGINKLAAVHRGFSTFGKSKFRNIPMWEFPIELKIRIPNLPVFCDPSHISGNKNLIYEVSQKAMDLNMEGLMIETHEHPEVAWSDSSQQITPQQLDGILEKLVIRELHGNANFTNHLSELRAKIDVIDEEIIQKIASRMEVAEKIGEYKKENNVTILQLQRWEEIIKDRVLLGKSTSLSEEFILAMLKLIHQESIRIQTEVMNTEKDDLSMDK